MDFKQSTIEEILDSEREMVLKGAERYGDYFHNASNFNAMLHHFLESINPDRFIFACSYLKFANTTPWHCSLPFDCVEFSL